LLLLLLLSLLLHYSLQEYADQDRLKALVSRYSEFIDFPIYLQVQGAGSIRL